MLARNNVHVYINYVYDYIQIKGVPLSTTLLKIRGAIMKGRKVKPARDARMLPRITNGRVADCIRLVNQANSSGWRKGFEIASIDKNFLKRAGGSVYSASPDAI